jgi:beta-glucosidase
MKKIFKVVLYGLGIIVFAVVGLSLALMLYYNSKSNSNMKLALDPSVVMMVDGHEFRDLNKNNRLDIYEDFRQAIDKRVENLLSQMTLDEKAGMMFVSMAAIGDKGSLFERPNLFNPLSFFSVPNSELILKKKINHVNLMDADATDIPKWVNSIQGLADRTRLGIPVTIASDPRNAFGTNPLAGFQTKGFSKWPEPLGFAAIGDTTLMSLFANVVRKEYRSVGITLALHPMADLATEPRWPRISGTFGEDAELASQMVYHYIRGFQGDSLSNSSVACMTKHFAGGGPQEDGLDPHFEFGKNQVYPGHNLQYHIIPFKSALKANTACIMPYYGIPVDQTNENVGFGFNKKMIEDVLRAELKFDGIVCTDWGVITDKKMMGITMFKSPGWGVENLTPAEKITKALNAGVDQFGGEQEPEIIADLVAKKVITVERIDRSVRRLLKLKFQLGLFDNPFIDVQQATKVLGVKENMEMGLITQGKAMVLLENKKSILPLQKGLKIYSENMAREALAGYGVLVDKPEEADVAIIRLQTPFQVHGEGFTESFFHHDDLDFKGKEKERLIELLKKVPTIIDIYLDRPAVIPELSENCQALLANFGAKDEVLVDVIFGDIKPQGNLPIEMPSSMEAVKNQSEDVPYDSKNPLYRFGYGLRYQ